MHWDFGTALFIIVLVTVVMGSVYVRPKSNDEALMYRVPPKRRVFGNDE